MGGRRGRISKYLSTVKCWTPFVGEMQKWLIENWDKKNHYPQVFEIAPPLPLSPCIYIISMNTWDIWCAPHFRKKNHRLTSKREMILWKEEVPSLFFLSRKGLVFVFFNIVGVHSCFFKTERKLCGCVWWRSRKSEDVSSGEWKTSPVTTLKSRAKIRLKSASREDFRIRSRSIELYSVRVSKRSCRI